MKEQDIAIAYMSVKGVMIDLAPGSSRDIC